MGLTIAAPETMRLMICTPCIDKPEPLYNKSLLHAATVAADYGVLLHHMLLENDSCITRARARCVYEFWKSPCDKMIFIDADEGFRFADIVAMIRSGKDIIGGVCPQKTINWDNVIREVRLNPNISANDVKRAGATMVANFPNGGQRMTVENGCVEVQDIGTGFMMISRECIEKMRAAFPELMCADNSAGALVDGISALFDPFPDPKTRRYLTEDFAFCRRWQSIGGKVYAYLHAEIQHVGKYIYEGQILDHLKLDDVEEAPREVVSSIMEAAAALEPAVHVPNVDFSGGCLVRG